MPVISCEVLVVLGGEIGSDVRRSHDYAEKIKGTNSSVSLELETRTKRKLTPRMNRECNNPNPTLPRPPRNLIPKQNNSSLTLPIRRPLLIPRPIPEINILLQASVEVRGGGDPYDACWV